MMKAQMRWVVQGGDCWGRLTRPVLTWKTTSKHPKWLHSGLADGRRQRWHTYTVHVEGDTHSNKKLLINKEAKNWLQTNKQKTITKQYCQCMGSSLIKGVNCEFSNSKTKHSYITKYEPPIRNWYVLDYFFSANWWVSRLRVHLKPVVNWWVAVVGV